MVTVEQAGELREQITKRLREEYQVALKQVEALTALGSGSGKQTILVPANALEAFGNAFNMLKGK